MALVSANMDERLANMIYNQQFQEKKALSELIDSYSVSNAEAEFHRGLKELVRDHLNTCMALASCSNSNEFITDSSNCSSNGTHRRRLNHVSERCNLCQLRVLLQQDEEEEGDQLVHRQHRANSEESAESSASRRRQSRILNKWAARQAQEMITTMERQAREAELLSLAGLHSVSTRDSSFLRESSPSRSVRSVERPSTRASSLVQMWRELEGESRVNSSRDRMRTRMAQSEAVEPRRGGVENQAFYQVSDVGEDRSITNNVNENASVTQSNEHREISEGVSYHSESGRRDVNNQTNNEVPGERNRYEVYRGFEGGQINIQNGHTERQCRGEQSVNLEEGESERVRQIVQRWMTESRMMDSTPNMTNDHDHRAFCHSEIEQERVRELSQEWTRITGQQRDSSGNMQQHFQRHEIQPGLVHMQARQREAVQGEIPVEPEENRQTHVNRNALRLRGRQAILDLLMRVERERQRELERLLEHRAVSDFSHRNRIQSLLRGRFLRSRAIIEEQRSSSTAAGELGQLRQRRTVSGLREGFRLNLDSSTGGQPVNHSNEPGNWSCTGIQESIVSRETESTQLQNESQSGTEESALAASSDQERDIGGNGEVLNGNVLLVASTDRQVVMQDGEGGSQADASLGEGGELQESTLVVMEHDWQETTTEVGHQDWQEVATEGIQIDWNGILQGVDMHWQGSGSNIEREWERDDTSQHASGEWQGPSEDIDWQESSSQELVRDWEDHSAGVSNAWQDLPTARRISDLQSLEDATEYNMELRELLSRRSVSTILASEFRERMDQLILSYIQNRGHPPVAWDMQEQHTDEQDDVGQNEGQINITDIPQFITPPPPPPPPPHQLWQREMQRPSRSRPLQHSEPEWEIINELRNDVARLQQGMSDMQHAFETCMEMQLELQRSVRQEVSAALNRSNGGQDNAGVLDEAIDSSKWVTVRKGICCICCEKDIDSLLYRCGHMCTCLKCANELVHNSGKCPMCRAPIVEVIRAYCQA